MATPTAFRLPDELLARVDALVASGEFTTRTDAIRTAIEDMLHVREEAAIDRAIADGYRRHPETDEEISLATAATRALIEDEPW